MACCRRTESETYAARNRMLIKDSRLPVIWVFGGPCSGKSTMCQRIIQDFNFMHIDCDNVLRFESLTESSRAVKITAQLNRQEPVPDEMLVNILKEIMPRNVKITDGYLLDNFPSNVDQGRLFEKQICPVTAVLYLKLSQASMSRRFRRRQKRAPRRSSDASTSISISIHDVPLRPERVQAQIRIFNASRADVLQQYESVLYILNAEKSQDRLNRMVEVIIDQVCTKASATLSSTHHKSSFFGFTTKIFRFRSSAFEKEVSKDEVSPVRSSRFRKLRFSLWNKKHDTEDKKNDTEDTKNDTEENKNDTQEKKTDTEENKNDTEENKNDTEENINGTEEKKTDTEDKKNDTEENKTDTAENKNDTEEKKNDTEE